MYLWDKLIHFHVFGCCLGIEPENIFNYMSKDFHSWKQAPNYRPQNLHLSKKLSEKVSCLIKRSQWSVNNSQWLVGLWKKRVEANREKLRMEEFFVVWSLFVMISWINNIPENIFCYIGLIFCWAQKTFSIDLRLRSYQTLKSEEYIFCWNIQSVRFFFHFW